MKKNKIIDYIICEGGYYRDFYNFSKYFGVEKMVLHLYHEFVPDDYIEKSFSHYLAVSEFIAEAWKRRLKNKSAHKEILKNCINIKRFKESIGTIDVREEYGLCDDFVIIYVGRIVPVKGVLQLINAFELAQIPNSKRLIVGSVRFGASETSAYEKNIIKRANFNENIILTGFIHNDKLAPYIDCVDLMVIPSHCEEAAGLVAIEGLCLNKTMVVTNSGGLCEFVDESNSCLIDKNKYFNKSISGDITNDMVLKTDWTIFEKVLSELLIKAYNEKDINHHNSETLAESFDISHYYENFMRIVEGFEEQREG